MMPGNFCQLYLFVAGLSIAGLTCATTASAAKVRSKKQQTGDSSTIVVIDAGHGGHDRGGIRGQRIPEKEMTLEVAQRLKKVLTDNGYRVVMTRESDVFVPLATRVKIANSYRNSVFVSVHFNSAKRVGADGIETYFYGRDSLPLASAVHYYVAGGASSLNRGVRRRGYYVLRKTRGPAVLVECGFLTNPSEAANIRKVSYRQKLAEEIAAGIRGRFNVRSSTSSMGVATIPLQSYIDQTKVSSKKRSRSKRSKKRSSSAKSSKKKKTSKSTGSKTTVASEKREG